MKLTDAFKATYYLTRLRAYNHGKRHTQELSGGVMDPQVKMMQGLFNLSSNSLPPDQKTPAMARADHMMSMVMYRKFSGPVAKVPNVWNSTIPGPAGDIPVRFYMPEGEGPFPIFVLYHGGGWVLGNLDTVDNMARTISYYGNVSVISVNYRLAPEHPFPAGLDDCYAAYLWAADPENVKQLRGDVDHLILGGDSVGGKLTADVSLNAAQENGPEIAQQVLIYPATDLSNLETQSFKTHGNLPLLTDGDMTWFIQQYAPTTELKSNPLVSPALATDLSNLPPALIMTAEFDILADDGLAYAQKLEEAGVDVHLIEAKGLPHGFISLRELIKRAHNYTILMLQMLNKRI